MLTCTCEYTSCPNHPSNHDKGCTPCIEKNLKNREIPCCFSVRAGVMDEMRDSYHFEDFARAVIQKQSGT